MSIANRAEKEQYKVGTRGQQSLFFGKNSLASVESLLMPLVQEVVLPADFRCPECQKRVADVISRMNEMDSVVVNVLDKKVTLTCRYPPVQSTQHVGPICGRPPGKVAFFRWLFRSPGR